MDLLHSRRFWTLIVDAVISIGLLFVGRYVSPADQELIKFVVAALQPVVAVVIAAYTVDDTVKAFLASRERMAGK